MGAGGRPTDYTLEKVTDICERLSNGEKLKDVLSIHKIARSTFFKWKRENKEFSDLYINVAQDKGELCIEEIDQTIEDLVSGSLDASTANVIIQTLKWKASKFYPKMYGDSSKVDVTTLGQPIENKSTVINVSVVQPKDED